jgi:hypothetical protein
MLRTGCRTFVTRRDMSNGHVVFQCPACQRAITLPLLPLDAHQSLCLEAGKPIVPRGFFWVSDGEHFAKDCAVVNLADLVSTKHHPDYRRLNGCCGLDGLDGPNLVCDNGHEVGTESSDCWTAHAAVLIQSAVCS